MAITRLSESGIVNFKKHRSMLAGNTAYEPTPPEAYDLLATEILTGSQASVTFSSLGAYAADYQHLQIRMTARDTGSGTYQLAGLRLNSDTGSNYASNGVFGKGSSADTTVATSTDSMNIAWYAGASAVSGAFGVSVIDLLDFSNTSKNTTLRSLTGVETGTTSRGGALFSGLWMDTNPVTSATIFARTVAFATNSRFSLYGLRKA